MAQLRRVSYKMTEDVVFAMERVQHETLMSKQSIINQAVREWILRHYPNALPDDEDEDEMQLDEYGDLTQN